MTAGDVAPAPRLAAARESRIRCVVIPDPSSKVQSHVRA